jgi:hypothetical protein
MVITTTDEYSNRDYKEGDYPTFNDIEYQAETETYLEKNPLARVALKSIMQNTKGDISKVLQNVDDDDASRDLYYKLKGVPIPNKGYIFPGEPEKFKQYSEEEKNNSAIVRLKLSSLDPEKQKTLTGHELGHYGLRVLLDEGRIDKKLFDKLQLSDEELPQITKEYLKKKKTKLTKEEVLMQKLSSRDSSNAGTPDENVNKYLGVPPSGFVSNADSNTLDSIAEDYLLGIANEDLGYAKGGDIMPMEQQMQMFAIGGLDDDGLSRDPVSGNEIPPGSMANEVRDDVEARLSDGEYVVPANVVRFFGVKFFEDLRTQAMQGLGAMEANGRIGGEPVPSDMPMQDQMAEVMPDVSEEEMQMLQGLMNEGGYVSGYAPGGLVPKDVDLENPPNYPFNPDPFSTVGASFFSPYNPNVTPDPNLPPTTMPVTPIPESGISFVTMVNPATGEIQLIQFMGGNPVDETAYNQLLSNGYFIQGSPELAQYKERIEQDNRDSDRPPARDSAGRLVTRPTPKGASVSELAQLISESSKGGSSILSGIPSLTGMVQGKLATGYQDKITETLKTRLADPKISAANKAALKELQTIWTNADLSKKDRVKAVSKTQLYVPPSTKNMLGRKKGKFGTEDWFGYATDDQIKDLFGGSTSTTKQLSRVDDFELPTTGTGSKAYQEGMEAAAKAASDAAKKASEAGFRDEGDDNDNRPVGSTSNDAGSGGANVSGDKDRETVGDTADAGKDKDLGYREDAGYGLMNKGGIIKKRKKKK